MTVWGGGGGVQEGDGSWLGCKMWCIRRLSKMFCCIADLFATFSLCGGLFATFSFLWGPFFTMWGPFCYFLLHGGAFFGLDLPPAPTLRKFL